MKFKNGFIICVFFFVAFGRTISTYAAPTPVPAPTPSPTPVMPTGVPTLGHDMVDQGKHLDWNGTSNYLNEWKDGVAIWNSYKPGVIRKDGLFTVNDVTISDCLYVPSNPFAVGATNYNEKTIVFSTYYMNKMTAKQRTHVAAHELGHCLGFADNYDSNASNTMMYYSSNDCVVLSGDEKDMYDWLYDVQY